MASVIAFLTPIGHHGNLLVYGPRRYKFSDFVKVGAPLTVICAVIVVVLGAIDLEKLKEVSHAQFMYASNAVNMILDRFAATALNFAYLPS